MEEETEMERITRIFHTPQPETRIERVEYATIHMLIKGKWVQVYPDKTQEELDRDRYLRSCKVN